MSLAIRLGLCAVAAASPMLAQDGARLGLAAGLSVPQGDFKAPVAGRTGLTLGASALLDLGPSVAIRPRVDFVAFPWRTTRTAYLAQAGTVVSEQSNRVSAFAAGADVVYYPRGWRQGVFVELGLEEYRWQARTTGRTTVAGGDPQGPGGTWASTDTSGRMAFAAGLGWRLGAHASLEGRYVVVTQGSTEADHAQLLCTYLF